MKNPVLEKKMKSSPKKKKKSVTAIVDELQDMDVRKQAFAAAYLDPMSITYGNALQSGIKAGFSREYSENILSLKPLWLSDIIGKLDYIGTVRRNIKKHLELETKVPVLTAFGPYIDKKTKKMVYHEDSRLLKIQQDMTTFVAERIIPDFQKKEKGELDLKPVEIKQIIIIAPNGQSVDYNKANSETVSSISEVA